MSTLSAILDLVETEREIEQLKMLLETRRTVEAQLREAAKQGNLSVEETLSLWELANKTVSQTRPKAKKVPNWSRN